jgi:hypothetical protein
MKIKELEEKIREIIYHGQEPYPGTTKKLLNLFTKTMGEVIGEDDKVPTEKKIEEMRLTLNDLEVAEKAVEFHARNNLRQEMRSKLK